MNMKNKKSLLIIGGLTVIATLLIFLIGITDGKRTIDYVSLLFVIIGECITFGVMAFYKQETMISNLSVTAIMPVYLLINIIYSLIFKNIFVNHITAFAVIHIIMIFIVAALLIVLGGLLSGINKDESETIKQKAVIDECERVANYLLQNAKYVSHKNKLNTIYDSIKYSDHVSDYKSSEILSVLNDISMCNNETETDLLCDKAIQLIQERNITVRQLKRGGF